jgi:hypothetical protein
MFVNRIIGVFKLDRGTFEEIEHDRTATGQAALVVAVVALLSGIGASFLGLRTGDFFEVFFGTIFWTFVGWIIWSGITLLIGTRLFNGRSDMGEMLRVIGFASAPLGLGIIPCIGGIVGVLWTTAAVFVALRQGLDLDGGRAMLTALVGFLVYALGYLVLFVTLAIFRTFIPA